MIPQVYITGQITDVTEHEIIASLRQYRDSPTLLVSIDSDGGHVSSTLAIVDAMLSIQRNSTIVATYAAKKAYSGASLVLAAGSRGYRCVTERTGIIVHEPQPVEILITAYPGSHRHSEAHRALENELFLREHEWERAADFYEQFTRMSIQSLLVGHRELGIIGASGKETGLFDKIVQDIQEVYGILERLVR
ncbi:MAG: ATP-dependent Clp protease proteolytic subunit [Candidatus Woesearchaeota archaeon]